VVRPVSSDAAIFEVAESSGTGGKHRRKAKIASGRMMRSRTTMKTSFIPVLDLFIT
jgi:hypothetical protein